MSLSVSVLAQLLDGGEIPLPNLLEMRLYTALDSPARSFSATFAADISPGNIGGITLCSGQTRLFSGSVDQQKFTSGARGRLLTVEARSQGALLLDNQALPCTLLGANLTVVFNRLIAPYGFALYNPNRSGTLPVFTVRAGMSEWDGFVLFCRRVYNITPYVKGAQIMLERPYSQGPLQIPADAAYSELTHTRTPYNMLSKVVLRDENGNYSVAVNNSAAAYNGVRRKRYGIPSTEYTGRLALDGNQRIKQSMLAAEEVKITLPGIIDAELGRDVIVKDAQFALYNLMVSARELVLDKTGVFTKLTLVNSLYYQ